MAEVYGANRDFFHCYHRRVMNRRFVTWLLLLAVLFNTLVGMPSHAATHLDSAAHGGHTHADDGDAHDEHGHDAEDGPAQVHQACVWCHNAGQVGDGMANQPFALPQNPQQAICAVEPASTFVPGLSRWRFASRDPPAFHLS